MVLNFDYRPKLVFYGGSSLLESPVWDSKNGIIYFVSIEQCLIFKLNTISGEICTYPTNGQIGCVILTDDNYLVSAEKQGIYKINPENGKREYITQIESNKDMRYNDGKKDPIGRFLVGTKGYYDDIPGEGKLYSFYKGVVKTLITNITISNGIDFSRDFKKMYFIDTPTKKIAQYKYDVQTGEVEFEKFIIEIDGGGYPDGMCVDIDGNLWVAEWEGGQVCKWNPKTGEKLGYIKMPCINVTSCCLGGKSLEKLYITTAKNPLKNETLAGGLFEVNIR